MKKLLLILTGVISITSLKAQSDNPESGVTTKSVYAELLGSGLAFSANFDSRFNGTRGLGYRMGLGVVPLKGNTALTIPFGLNAIFGKKSSFFEAEFTATVLTSSSGKFNGKNASAVFIYPHVGYRYTRPAKSFIGRVCIGPMIYGGEIIPYGGLSFGYTL
ncbi:MAG TPA: hypothetical protein VG847_01570 [Chitinophagaceae bacterium]|nr:hypothetical protein [Chitinophagaceae bacterium]